MIVLDCNLRYDAVQRRYVCDNCGWTFAPKRLCTNPPRRNCPNSPDLTEARERLGISVDDMKHWAQALARWTRAGFPTRSQAEVERCLRICVKCDQYVGGRCKSCGCRVSKSRIAVANKLKMATERCPKGHWGETPDP